MKIMKRNRRTCKSIVKKKLQWGYRFMQEHWILFRALVWLEAMGVTEWLMVSFSDTERNVNHKALELNRAFFVERQDDVKRVLKLLEDEKSKKVFKACIDYRSYHTKIPSGLYSEKNQYFDEQLIVLKNQELFIDCGAFIGDTIQIFIMRAKKARIKDYSIVAFEPSSRNAAIIEKYFKKNAKVRLVKKGVSNCKKAVPFIQDGLKSKVDFNSEFEREHIEVVPLDSIEECQKATYIKMDIEGQELSALEGAKTIIQKNKPKLAICIYHSNEDMLDIPIYIKKLNPQYKLYVRHYSRGASETVLYAI